MKIIDIIAEIQFSIYQAMVRIGHTDTITVQDVGEMLSQVSHDGDNNTAVMKVKLLTTKPPSEAFLAFKETSIKRIPEVRKVEVAEKTIEKKK